MNAPPEDTLGPYRGLESFDEAHAAFFFGREREPRLIIASLFASPLTILYGTSGVGKSSVLRAGVLPGLRQRRELLPVIFPVLTPEPSEPAVTAVTRGWRDAPLTGVKDAIILALKNSASEDTTLANNLEGVRELPLSEFLKACYQLSKQRIMVIIDQFEEYFFYHPEDDEFGLQFPGAVTHADFSVSFLISLREDAMAKLDRFKGRIPQLWNSYRRIDHLDRTAAEDAIRLPLRKYNELQPQAPQTEIENELVQKVLDDVEVQRVQFPEMGSGGLPDQPSKDARIETPYLQLVMARIWEKEREKGSHVLRLTTLQDDEGGAREIVRTHLDKVMNKLLPAQRDLAARIFHRLVTPSGVKIAYSVDDLAEYEGISSSELNPVLLRLEQSDCRVLRRVAAGSNTSKGPCYEIFHDRLGQAVLSWRTKHLLEQERNKGQREEAERRQLAEQTQSRVRETLSRAMNALGQTNQASWARMMFYLVSMDHRRLTQTAQSLTNLSGLPGNSVETILQRLKQAGILRVAYGSGETPGRQRYEVAEEELVPALIQWHSNRLLDETRNATTEFPQDGLLRNVAGQVRPPLMPAREFPYDLIHDGLQRGTIIPVLGLGASISARLNEPPVAIPRAFPPSYRELKEVLARDCDFPPSYFETSDLAQIATLYDQVMGRPALDRRLHQILGHTDFTPAPIHRYLAEVAKSTPLLIFTTNYDTLMEQALAQSGQRFDVIAYVPFEQQEAKLAYLPWGSELKRVPLQYFSEPNKKPLVYRLCGPGIQVNNTTGSYVLTEEDWLNWLFQMSTNKLLPQFVRNRMETSRFLLLGLSVQDWSQRALVRMFDEYARISRWSKAWSVAFNPSPLNLMTWQRYKVAVYNADLNEWTARMSQELHRT